jgi:hypothetical protein
MAYRTYTKSPELPVCPDDPPASRVEVIGVNSIDNDEKGLARLSDFVEKNELSYHILLAGRAADSLYQVSGYPSLYIIDSSGRIAYAQPGFYEAMNDTIETVLNGQL